MNRYRCVGRCHCGNVRFAVDLPGSIQVRRCNCSICSMTGHVHLTVAGRDFEITQGEDELTQYQFNSKVARHLFCQTCGIKAFYVPRSHPDAWSVNLNCVTVHPDIEVEWGTFDGQHWEENIDLIGNIVN